MYQYRNYSASRSYLRNLYLCRSSSVCRNEISNYNSRRLDVNIYLLSNYWIEATQSTEPSSLCALVKGSEQVVLLGDHFQLPPTVISTEAQQGILILWIRLLKGGFDKSLFQRLVDAGVEAFLLDTQYRSKIF